MTGRYFSGDKESFRFDCAFKLQKFRYIIVLPFLIHMHRIFLVLLKKYVKCEVQDVYSLEYIFTQFFFNIKCFFPSLEQ